jgi:hypothetical protein
VRVVLLLEALIFAVATCYVPVKIPAAGRFELALEANTDEVGVDVLEEQAAA